MEWWASLAMSLTQLEKGVPFCPETCCLLSPWQYLPYFLALLEPPELPWFPGPWARPAAGTVADAAVAAARASLERS